MPHSHLIGIASDCMYMWQAITNGMVANTKKIQKEWDYWCDYLNVWKIYPFLSSIYCPIQRDVIVTAFTAWVRSGIDRKIYDQSSRSHGRSHIHLQDQPISWKPIPL